MLEDGQRSVYFAENAPVKGASKRLFPSGIQSLFISVIGQKEVNVSQLLVMWSRTQRAMSQRDRQWASAVGAKLSKFL